MVEERNLPTHTPTMPAQPAPKAEDLNLETKTPAAPAPPLIPAQPAPMPGQVVTASAEPAHEIKSTVDMIVIIDAEHFPTMVGLKETRVFMGYTSWYTYLIGKCAHDMLFSTKKERYDAQKVIVSTLAPYASIDLESRLDSQHCAQPCLLHA